MKQQEVELKKPGQDLVTYDFGDDAGKGLENLDVSEYRIPFIRILDPKSPQCKPPASGGIAGAKGGTVFNTATGEIWPGEAGFDFVPCARDHNWVQFHHRDVGGGFVRQYPADDAEILKMVKAQGRFKKLLVDPAHDAVSDQISEVFYLYGLMLPPGEATQRVVIGFGGMQIKKYQAFMTRYMNLKYPVKNAAGQEVQTLPPLWAHRWHLSTVYEERKDQSWYGWKIRLAATKPDGTEEAPRLSLIRLNEPLYQEGRDFNRQIAEGMAKADMSGAGGDPGPAEEESPM